MITHFSRADLAQIIEEQRPPCVSIYLPTHTTGRERQQDEVRLKNVVREAERQLKSWGTEREKIAELLDPVVRLPRDSDKWPHRGQGMAIFAAHDFFAGYTVPLEVAEFVIVTDRFHVSPLAPLLQYNRHYFVLALNKDAATLYEASRYSIVERELPEMNPIEIDDDERPLQYHSHRAPSVGKGGTGEAIYHGQGGPAERDDVDVANFFTRQVDPVVSRWLRESDAPLVLACVDRLAPIYRSANTYAHLIDGHVSGSPAERSDDELRERAWQVVAPTLQKIEKDARRKFEDLAGSDRTSTTAQRILEAASQGRVETLFVSADVATAPNARHNEEGIVSRSASQVEEATVGTIRHGGQVLAVDQPPGSSLLAAVFRY